MKKIVLLGASGSIGVSTLRVIDRFPDRLSLVGISVHSNYSVGYKILQEYINCRWLVVSGQQNPKIEQYEGKTVAYGRNFILEMIDCLQPDIVVFALPGGEVFDIFWGILKRKMPIAMANKECLVISAPMITPAVKKVNIIPIDSEQVGLWQILPEELSSVRRVIITCSGGPFWGKSRRELKTVTAEQALKHPRWKMGPKVSLDSATLMNKALEIIETIALFGIDRDKVSTVIHPQSEVHAAVELVDGNLLLNASRTDMQIAIQYALSYPQKWENLDFGLDRFGRSALQWDFLPPDKSVFTSLEAVDIAIEKWDSALTVLNTANDLLGRLFFEGKIGFLDIMDLTVRLLELHKPWQVCCYDDIKEAVIWTQQQLRELIKLEL